jgi:hypothetical protein
VGRRRAQRRRAGRPVQRPLKTRRPVAVGAARESERQGGVGALVRRPRTGPGVRRDVSPQRARRSPG